VSVLGGYVVATGVVSVFGAATQGTLMVILGAPLALPVFVLSFFLGYIPYIGGMIGTFLATLLTITTGNPVAIAIMVIFTIVFNIAQGNVIQPLVFGKAVNLHPAIILLAIPAGNAVAGVMGMFLVVPVLGIVATTWRPLLAIIGPPPAATRADPAESVDPVGLDPVQP
jgi:predicted PurR-regulated permease PerM